MNNTQYVQQLTKEYAQKIIDHINDNNLESIEFINPIMVLIQDQDNNTNFHSCITQFIDADGMVGGINQYNQAMDWSLNDMSLEELAYILDIINSYEFYEYNDQQHEESNLI